MTSLLSKTEIETALRAVPGWRCDGAEISRTFALGNFVESVEFVNRITELAEEANHHPDVDIRWNKVMLRLSTHSKGGLTAADFALAAQIDDLAA
ncbi:MAG: 4a-hydroxytetrahydrobiopterin dehydratase [Terrimicrobiaceae bacterium]|nr:4a-hydroxytetrahydrobiopterin dehydratase [Terrimicrobiaceae bacterium]